MWNTGPEEQANMSERPEELEPPVNIGALKQSLAEAKTKAEENLASWQRAQADFSNFRRRLEQDKVEAIKYAESEMLLKLLPALDDLDRAVKAIPANIAGEAWVTGVAGIARKFHNILESVGLTEISAMGQPFDPNIHDCALLACGPADIIVAEYEKGYQFRDKIIRHARVAVGSGQNEEDKAS
jgi:molecular chaperone GrpE